MMFAQAFQRPETDDRAAALGVLGFLAVLAAALAATLIGSGLADGHAPHDLRQLNELLPADPTLWVGFTA